MANYHDISKTVRAGMSLDEADKLIIMVHGRGANPYDIVSLRDYLQLVNFAIWAPAASYNQWYPYSFLAPPQQNEPGLSSALELLGDLVKEAESEKFLPEQIFLLGFSQGACLTLEYAARNAERYGGVIAFTGGLIGDKIYEENYGGNFAATPVYISSGDPDPHLPVERVEESARIIEKMGADVTMEIFKGRPHTISQNEIEKANIILGTSSVQD